MMRLLPLFAMLSGCALLSSGTRPTVDVTQVKPLPPERHVDDCRETSFYPDAPPAPDDLFLCGTDKGVWRCVDYRLFLEQVEEAKKPASGDVQL